MEMDGLLNLWIIKPGCSSRGRGITISNRLERILGIVEHGAGAKQARYTVLAMVRTPLNIQIFEVWTSLCLQYNRINLCRGASKYWRFKSFILHFISPFTITHLHK